MDGNRGHVIAESYLAAHNTRFPTLPADPTDFHQPLQRGLDLNSVFS